MAKPDAAATHPVPTKQPGRFARFFIWIGAHWTELLTAVIGLTTVGLTIADLVGTVDPAIILIGLAVLLTAVAGMTIQVQVAQAKQSVDVGQLRQELAEVKKLANRIPPLVRELGVIQADVRTLATQADFHEVKPDLIDDHLLVQLNGAKGWNFRGGSAGYQRSTVLPRLSEIKTQTVRYRAQVLNPFDDDLCQQYAEYRLTQRTGRQAVDDAKGSIVQRDLLAFLFALAWYTGHGRLSPRITLLDTYSPMRIDASDSAVIVTVPSRAAPGLRATNDSWYYKSLLDEYEQTDLVLRELVLPNKLALKRTAASAREYFEKLRDANDWIKPGHVIEYTDDEWQGVVDKAFEAVTS